MTLGVDGVLGLLVLGMDMCGRGMEPGTDWGKSLGLASNSVVVAD